MKVVNIGSLNYDYVYGVEHIVQGGETISSKSMTTFCGGKGLNQSIALAKAGVLVYQGGMIGEDGDLLLEVCRENGVNTQYIRQIAGKSGHAIIQVDQNAQNSILLFGGANRSLTKEYVDGVLSGFEAEDILILQNEVNNLDYIIERAYEKHMMIVLNPSPFNQALCNCDMNKISIFMLNEIEGEQMTGFSDPEKILDAMMEKYPQARVVLTLGEAGVEYRDCKQSVHQGIFKVQAVDTTAAGDTFTGFFIAGLIDGLDIKKNLKRCAKASAITVSRQGATNSIPTLEEIDKIKIGLDCTKE